MRLKKFMLNSNEFISHVGKTLLPYNQQQKVYGFWNIDCKFNPNGERCFNYKIAVIKTKYQGVAYYSDELSDAESFSIIGSSISEIKTMHNGVRLALLDSLAPRRVPDRVINLHGDSISKSLERAKILSEYSVKLLEISKSTHEIDFVNVGVVSLLMRNLVQKGYLVKGSDFDRSVIDDKNIFDGMHTLELISKSKVAIVTGMTMTNGSIIDIMKVAKKSGTKVIMFNETGAGLNNYLFDLGVDLIIAEPFPFYIFDGDNTIEIHQKNDQIGLL